MLPVCGLLRASNGVSGTYGSCGQLPLHKAASGRSFGTVVLAESERADGYDLMIRRHHPYQISTGKILGSWWSS